MLQTLKDIRRDFHKNPEIGLVTPQTSGKIASLLRSFGVNEVHEGIGGCGVVGVVRGARPGSLRVGLRADIDSAPLGGTFFSRSCLTDQRLYARLRT